MGEDWGQEHSEDLNLNCHLQNPRSNTNPGYLNPIYNYLEGAPPVQVGPSGGHLYEGNLGGGTGVGGALNPKPHPSGGKKKPQQITSFFRRTLNNEEKSPLPQMAEIKEEYLPPPPLTVSQQTENCLVRKKHCTTHQKPAIKTSRKERKWCLLPKTGLYGYRTIKILEWKCESFSPNDKIAEFLSVCKRDESENLNYPKDRVLAGNSDQSEATLAVQGPVRYPEPAHNV